MADKVYPLVKRWNPQGWYEWVETEPESCSNGHLWGKPFTMQRGHMACGEHGGHRTWTCRTCGELILDPVHEGELPRHV